MDTLLEDVQVFLCITCVQITLYLFIYLFICLFEQKIVWATVLKAKETQTLYLVHFSC